MLRGANGQGKTSVLEAVGWVARARSFRGVSRRARWCATAREQAIVRAEVVTGERVQLFEAEIRAAGRNRILCNKQSVTRARDLHGLLRVTRVRARRPRAGEGRPVANAARTSTSSS